MQQEKFSSFYEYDFEVTTLNRPEGKYSIIYGSHDRPQNPNQLPHDMSAIALEAVYIGNDYWIGPDEKMVGLNNIQYNSLFPSLIEQKTPILGLDVAANSSRAQLLIMASTFLSPAVESGVGVSLGAHSMRRSTHDRRSFLKKAGALTASAYLGLPLVAEGAMYARSKHEGLDRPLAEFIKVEGRVHPEDNLLVLQARNRIYAMKEEKLMNLFPENPHIATVLGTGHVGFENAVTNSFEENLDFLYKIKPVLQVFLPASIHTAFKYDFDGSGWNQEIYTIPELEELADKI